ncbi:hypothetical protein CSUB01_08510 [Colletotrichum sublineola]|uniref:Uncharacterized protein n=1 Tax=Colletotrichum sublineola TaxID=1173701 RepID=A0A066X4X7_COLSU|nr:hypothetical protein CSUB01_08510 [Colletotrichum sublineola]
MEYCDQDTLRILVLCNRLFQHIGTPVLYRQGLQSFIPRSVSWAISECDDDSTSLRVLKHAQQSGEDFQRRLPYDCFIRYRGIEVFTCRWDDRFRGTQLLSAFQLAVLLGRDKILSFLLESNAHDKELIDGTIWSLLLCLVKHPTKDPLFRELGGSNPTSIASATSLQRVLSRLDPFGEGKATVVDPYRRTPVYFAPWFPMSMEETLDYLFELGIDSRVHRSAYRTQFAIKAKAFRPRCKLW